MINLEFIENLSFRLKTNSQQALINDLINCSIFLGYIVFYQNAV